MFRACFGQSLRLLVFAALLSTANSYADPLPVANIQRDKPVDFATEIFPALKQNCVSCHNAKLAEGGLNLETHAALIKGGDSGPGAIASNLDDSLVFQRGSGSLDDIMPPEDNKAGAKTLTPEQLGLLKLWINQGATNSETVFAKATTSEPVDWQPIPESVRTIYAADISPDNQLVAAGHGNRVSIYDLDTGKQVAKLIDPDLQATAGEVTDIDLIHSIAFSPDGNRLATGGFRTVKIWQKSQTSLANDDPRHAKTNELVAAKLTDEATERQQLQSNEALQSAYGRISLRRNSADTDPQVRDFAFITRAEPAISQLAIATENGVEIFNVADGQPIRKIDHGGAVQSLAVSPDGSQLATAGSNGETKIWNTSDGQPIRTISGSRESRLALAAATRNSARQKTAVSRLNSKTPELKKAIVQENEAIKKFVDLREKAIAELADKVAKQAEAVSQVAIAKAAIAKAHAATAQAKYNSDSANRKIADNKATVGRITKEIAKTKPELDKANKATADAQQKVDAAQKLLADAKVVSDKLAAEAAAKKTELDKANEAIAKAQKEIEAANKATADAKSLLDKSTAELEAKKKAAEKAETDKQKGEQLIPNREQALATARQSHQRAVALVPTHQQLVSSETTRSQQFEKSLTELQAKIAAAKESCIDIAYSSDGLTIATLDAGRNVRTYRASDGLPLASHSLPDSESELPNRIVIIEDRVVTFREENPDANVVWPLQANWQLELTIGNADTSPISDRVAALDFHSDGILIAVGSGPASQSGDVQVFSVETGESVKRFGEIHSDTVLSVQFSPDGRSLASAAADKTIRLLSMETGQVLRSCEGHTHHVLAVAWQDNGQTLASASADQTIKVWSAETGEQRRTIKGFGKELAAIAFIETTGQVVTACGDGQLRLHKTGDGGAVRSFDAKGDFLYTLAVTPDGKTLVAGGLGGTLRSWNVADGKPLHTFK